MQSEQDRPYKILIVDDGKDFREALSDFLTLFGYQVQEASDGRKALELLRKDRNVDLVLLDVHMPGLSGMEVLAKIKQTTPQLSVILLTGDSAQDIAASVPKGYTQDCIEKTMDPDKISRLIEKVLNKSEDALTAAINLN
jgi:DNA-binding NtrC family response regulator